MICPNRNDPKVMREFNELVSVFGENVAHALWQHNTGYPLDFTKSGERSYLFDGLKRVTGSREGAMKLKALIYTGKARLREPTLDEFLRELRDAPFSKRAPLNLPESQLNHKGIARYLIDDIKKSILSKKHIGAGTNSVDFVYPTPQQSYAVAHRIMTKLNKQYGSKVASLDTSHAGFTRLYIMPSPELVDEFLRKELQVRAENMKLQETKEFLARDRESNEFVNDEGDVVPYDDGDYADYSPPEPSRNSKTFGEGFTNIVEYYKEKDRRINKRIKDLKTKALDEGNPTERYRQLDELKAESTRIKQMMARLKEEAAREGNPEVSISSISLAAEMELNRVRAIFDNPTADNLIEADAILDFYTSINIIEGKDDKNLLLSDVQLTGVTNHTREIDRLTAEIEDDIQMGNIDEATRKQEWKRRVEGEKILLDQLNGIAAEAYKLMEPFEKAIKNLALIKLQEHPMYNKIATEGMTIETLFKDIGDIDAISSFVLGPDFTYSGEDSVIAQVITSLFRDVLTDKDAFSTELKEAIDQVEKATNKELKRNGETQADVFYQHDEYGNARHYLIDKFSNEWFEDIDSIERTFRSKVNRAYKLGGEARARELNQAEADKFESLKAMGDFVNPANLKAVKQEFSHLAGLFASDEECDAYEQALVNRIGRLAVDRIIQEQQDKFREFNFILIQEIRTVFGEFIEFDESTILQDIQNRLSEDQKKRISAFFMTHNPIIAAANAAIGASNILNGPYGHPIYNKTDFSVIIPKEGDEHARYIDSRFDKIESNEIYQKAWQALSRSIKYINTAVADRKKGSHNALYEYRNNIWQTLMDKRVPRGVAIKNAWNQFGDWVKFLLTGAGENLGAPSDETEISRSKFKEIKGRVEKSTNRDLRVLALMMNVPSSADLSSNVYRISELSQDTISYIAKIAGINPTATALEAAARGTHINMGKFIESQHNTRIMLQQKLDLFKMNRYYLAEAARYDAAKTILPLLRILKRVYNNIKQPAEEAEGSKAKQIVRQIFTGKKPQERTYAVKRMDNWFNRVVRGYTGVHSIPIKGIKKLRTKEEKLEAEKINLEIEQLEKVAQRTMDMEQKAGIKDQIDELIRRRDSLGRHVDVTALFSLAQTYIIFKGLAYNVKSSLINYVTGYMSSQIHDSLGYFWTPGNFDVAHSFIIGKGRKNFYRLASIAGKPAKGFKYHAEQIEIAEILFAKTGIIQDVRDEKQKSTTRLGKEDLTNKSLPFYISVTAIEWRNQGADILAILMDQTITSADGLTTVKMFDGKGFPALEKKDGKLVLKEEFRTPENINNWEKLTGKEYKAFKQTAQAAIIAAQGDYSTTSGMRLKSYTVGRTLAIFRTFLPMAVWTRIGSGMILSAGKNIKKGMYKRHNPVTGAVAGGAMGFVAGGPLGMAIGAMTGSLAGGLYGQKRPNPELTYAKEYITIGKALVLKLMGTPVNLVAGKRIELFQTDLQAKLEGHLPEDQRKFTEEDVNALQGVMKEISFLVWFAAMQFAFRAALSCDDEDTYACKVRMRASDFIDNLVQQMFDDASAYMSPSGMYNLMASSELLPIIRFFMSAGRAVDAINRASEGEDLYTTGKDAGESRTYNSVKRVLVPGIFNTTKEVTSIFVHDLDAPKDYNPNWTDRKFAPIKKRVKRKIDQDRTRERTRLREAGMSDKYINKKLKEKYPTITQKQNELKKKYPGSWKRKHNQWLKKRDEE